MLGVIMLTCGTVLLLTCTAFFVYEYITYREITKREMATLGQIVAANSTSSLAFDDRDDANEILRALKAQKHIVSACIYDSSGHVFARYPKDVSPLAFPAAPQDSGYTFRNSFMEGFEPIRLNGTRVGILYLKSDMKDVSQRFTLYGIIAFSFIVLSFIFAYFLSKRLQRTISDPILQLAGAAREVSDKKDYSVRVHNRANDELSTLTAAFNHMLTEIQLRNQEIVTLNETLEEKITLRTAELKNANAILLEQNHFIETIIDASIDLIAVFDKDLKYLALNRQAAETFKRKKEEVIGKNIVDVFPNLRDAPLLDNLQKALKGAFIKVSPYRSLVTDHYFENFFIPLKNNNHEIDRVLLVGHDITSIMQANDKLMKVNTELEKSNRDLEQFAYVASHDLQEPLRKIQTFADLSQKNAEQPDILRRYLQKIISSAARMSELIRAVLNYSRLARIHEEFNPVDLNAIIDNIKVDLELLIAEKEADVQTETLPVVRAVPLQMNQLFLNLFTNALKFSEKKPEIRISASFVSAKDLDRYGLPVNDANYLRIAFSDNGIGFDPRYAEQVFAIFQRLHGSESFAGTGIGLALCKKIVENHGGFITVESEPGKGSSFFIFFPGHMVEAGKPSDQKAEERKSSDRIVP